jgi:hypothetical protein
MLGNAHFYNRTIRKVVVAFGTMFNDIHLYRYDKQGTEHQRLRVPLSYGAKEKYITRLSSDPTLTKSIATIVPRMSFNLDSMNYDMTRKQLSTIQNFAFSGSPAKVRSQYVPVPYDFQFSLSIYVRNTEDGTQILEQILPFFTPDFTVTVDFIGAMDQKYDMPVILNSVNSTVDYEGDMMTTRLIMWDLEFTAKGYIWPPVQPPDGSGNTVPIIETAITNIYANNSLDANSLISTITVQPDPPTANVDDEFGFSETITNYPDTL